ncbi:OmpA family protein [Sedimentitalea nanhaiensis]|uniref:Outer membrane protein OmpA n=2 Tax=Sedimentitalea nanhaiensis TaxID=999627 RepID=A0A1I7D8Z2_9RHOB|nr:OmpA family protein [Sedimentitalea nanhaiensis]SFU08075.1 Outer membrane protein OmpA [Sedimentitalea nanhaiensis]
MVRLSKFFAISVVAGLGLAAPSVLLAQDVSTMSAEEIADAFKKQKTRGLVIVPATQDATSGNATSVIPAAAKEYTAVDREDQVNIQISFDFDSAALREDQKVKLATLCEVMKSVDVSVFQIVGHTDSSGSAAYNERLSLLRAQEVKHHLVSDCGIPDNRLEAIGMGESAPYDETNPRADTNRRVEFQALG